MDTHQSYRIHRRFYFASRIFLIAILCGIFLGPISSSAQTIDRSTVSGYLESGGLKRRQAIWYIYQKQYNDLLRVAVQYLFESDDYDDHRAIFRVLEVYGFELEHYLPDWYNILDRYMTEEIPDDLLIRAMKLSVTWRERRMMLAIGRLATHPKRNVRVEAFKAMTSLGDDNLLPILLGLANGPRPIDRIYALEGARYYPDNRFQPFLDKLQKDESKSVRLYAIEATAAAVNGSDKDYLVVRTYQEERDEEVRERILELIGEYGLRRQNYFLHRALLEDSFLIRRAALKSILKLKDRTASTAISQGLARIPSSINLQQSGELKELSLEILAKLKSGGGGEGLSNVILYEQSPVLRRKACAVVGIVVEHGAAPTLAQAAVEDKDPTVRMECINAIGLLRDDRYTQVLRNIVENEREVFEVKSQAVVALFQIGSYSSLGVLKELKTSLNDRVLRSVIERRLGKSNFGR